MSDLAARLVARHPLPAKRLTAHPALDTAYAAHAADHGARGPWWRVWRALVRTAGLRLPAALAALTPQQRRWFALWSFARGRHREGATAYRAYTAAPGDIGPFDGENAIYLAHVAATRPDRLVAEADRLRAITATATASELIVLRHLCARGDGAALAARYPAPRDADLHDGDAWARHAIACARAGIDGTRALELAAKLGVGSARDLALRDLLCAELGLTVAAWDARRAPWAPPTGDLQDAWRADPGLTPVPTAANPHHYGGDTWALPDCPGCGHRMHAFFTFDVAAEPALRARIPSWPRLPLVGCLDCALWLMRRDFEVTADEVRLIGVSASAAQRASFGRPHTTLPPIARQPVALAPVTAPESDRTQVAGTPDWVQDHERAFCPRCAGEMTFVAALGSMVRTAFVPELFVNNGSGYQYHFACDPCRTLAVFGQNT